MHHHTENEQSMSQDEFEASFDLIECRKCSSQFNLGAQPYYTNLCPKCYSSDE